MAFKRLNLGPLGIAITANEHAAGFHVSFAGSGWRDFVRERKARRAQEHDAASVPQPVRGSGIGEKDEALRKRVEALTWYHTIDLGGGLRTPGRFDHAPILDKYRLPESLAGLRVLDVATYDGFWAFEFEKRGAAEVVALDLDTGAQLDWSPPRLAAARPDELTRRFGEGFELARERLGSKARRVASSVYDLRPEVHGEFDVVHSGDFLLHINNPVRALQNMARVCRGYALISDVYFPELDALGAGAMCEYRGFRDNTWWRLSLAALEQMIQDAGFSRVELLNKFEYGYSNSSGRWHHAVFKATK